MQSRYYNPELGRFISADKYTSTGKDILGSNMFVYCNNNPVMYIDPSGEIPWLVIAVLFVPAIAGGIWGAFTDKKLWTTTEEGYELTFLDRVNNTIIGMSMGLLVSGSTLVLAGATATIVAGSATTIIPLFGMTGPQVVAIGALAHNFVAMVIAPFLGIEMEPLELEP